MTLQLPSLDDIGAQILTAIKSIADNDLPELNDFATAQLEDLKTLTQLTAKGALPNGWIDDEEDLKYELARLRRLTIDFIHTLAALATLALEKTINAVLGVINGIIMNAFGLRTA